VTVARETESTAATACLDQPANVDRDHSEAAKRSAHKGETKRVYSHLLGLSARSVPTRPLCSRLPAARVLPTMNGQHDNSVVDDLEVHGVREPVEDRASSLTLHAAKQLQALGNTLDRLVESTTERRTKPLTPALVPVACVECFRFGLRPKRNAMAHSRSSSFRRTSFHGTAEPGCLRCSAQRRSNSRA
jgi:hypothetical protein